ncbi:MAG: cytochrome c [Gammaproteobacteria bacterium]|nr:cytochrome c [Gammaproteobacteria bacterium]
MTLLVAAVLAVAGAVVFVYSGVYDVSASIPHNAVSNWAMATTRQMSVERRAKDIAVPNLSDEALPHAGVNDFEAMCVGCHGAPGKQPGPAGQGLNPPAPDLQQVARERTPAELFWVIKHGVRMTGMPAWGATHEDEALWPVVALIMTLPDLDTDAYKRLLDSAKGMGHHADRAGSDHGTHDHDALASVEGLGHHPDRADSDHGAHDHDAPASAEDPPEPEQQPEHDHSTHEH